MKISCGPFTFAAFDLIKKDLQEDFDSSILSYFFFCRVITQVQLAKIMTLENNVTLIKITSS